MIEWWALNDERRGEELLGFLGLRRALNGRQPSRPKQGREGGGRVVEYRVAKLIRLVGFSTRGWFICLFAACLLLVCLLPRSLSIGKGLDMRWLGSCVYMCRRPNSMTHKHSTPYFLRTRTRYSVHIHGCRLAVCLRSTYGWKSPSSGSRRPVANHYRGHTWWIDSRTARVCTSMYEMRRAVVLREASSCCSVMRCKYARIERGPSDV